MPRAKNPSREAGEPGTPDMTVVLTMVFSLVLSSTAFAANDPNDPAYERAREDYRAYLRGLKALNQQYKEFSSEMRKIMQEEGLPVWEESTGGLDARKGNFGDADIQETD